MNCEKHIYQEINGVVNICQVCWKKYDLATQLNYEVYCAAKIYILLVCVKSPKSFFPSCYSYNNMLLFGLDGKCPYI